MSERTDFWDRVNKVGEHLGLSKRNLLKMRQRRNVPPKYHIPLFTTAHEVGVSFELDEFNSHQ
jgi:hypothetical protein